MDDPARKQDHLEGMTYTTDTLQELLGGVSFPIEAEALGQHLERRGAPQPVVEGIRTSGVARFEGVEEVMEIIGGFAV